MSDHNKLFLYTPLLEVGGYPSTCPFNTHRAGQTRRIVESMGLLAGNGRREIEPVALTNEELSRFHTASYLDGLRKAGMGLLDPDDALWTGLGTMDCPIFENMYDYVSLAAGGSVTGAHRIIRGDASLVFNPSGGFHHAQPDHASGFCYINDVVLAA